MCSTVLNCGNAIITVFVLVPVKVIIVYQRMGTASSTTKPLALLHALSSEDILEIQQVMHDPLHARDRACIAWLMGSHPRGQRTHCCLTCTHIQRVAVGVASPVHSLSGPIRELIWRDYCAGYVPGNALDSCREMLELEFTADRWEGSRSLISFIDGLRGREKSSRVWRFGGEKIGTQFELCIERTGLWVGGPCAIGPHETVTYSTTLLRGLEWMILPEHEARMTLEGLVGKMKRLWAEQQVRPINYVAIKYLGTHLHLLRKIVTKQDGRPEAIAQLINLSRTGNTHFLSAPDEWI